MSAGSGPPWREPFATYDRASSCWRTSQPSLFEDLLASPPTWPKSGTWDLGAAYERPMSVPVTAGSGSSSSPGLLRTPTAQLAVNGGSRHPDKRREGGHGPTLADEIEHLLPTPTSNISGRMGEQHTAMRRSIGRNTPSQLEAAAQLLPTPNATDSQGGPRAVPERRTSRGPDHGPRLRDVAPGLLPTPAARDWKSGQSNLIGTNARPLNEVVEMLLPTPMAADGGLSRGTTGGGGGGGFGLRDASRKISRGAPTSRPSADGKPSLAGPPPGQLSLDEPESD